MNRPARLAALIAFTALLLSALSPTALAQGSDALGAYGGAKDPNRYRTGQEFMLELRVQQYIPDVDAEFADGQRTPRTSEIAIEDAGGPYEYVFGKGRRYAVGFEFDWQVFRIPYIGTVGPAYGFLSTKSTAKARSLKDPETKSGEETALTIIPMYLVAVLRADVIWNEFGIPLIPYAKGGVGWALWWSQTGGKVDTVNGVRAQGTTFGYQFALGGALLLDFFDEEAAGEMDNSIGVNHSYIFAEWYVSKLEGGGIFKKQMYVGTNSWAAGLAFEF